MRLQCDETGEALVDRWLGELTLEQKVGQCFTFLWSGHMVMPSVVEAIERLHCGALRLQPYCLTGTRTKYYNFDTAGGRYDYPAGYEPVAQNMVMDGPVSQPAPAEYAGALNRLQAIAVNRAGGLPLTFSIDQEGDFSRDYCHGGIALFPAAMGLAATGDPDLVYRARRATAEQLASMGITTIHSPVLDINIAPTNPEIGTRAYGDSPEQATRFALAALRGIQDGGLIATAKHFPGRGDSGVDAHHDVPVIRADRARLDAVELYPYRELIAAGLDSIMLAHTVYPALDPDNLATVSRRIVTGVLREELGFDGVITTDAIAMGALVERHSLPTACALALQAGADMVLNKTETAFRDQGYLETLRFVREGRIPESDIDRKVQRILRMKYRRGLFASSQVDPARATAVVGNRDAVALAETVARRACLMLWNRHEALPLSPARRIAVVEQAIAARNIPNTPRHHRLSFTEAMLAHSMNITAVDTPLIASEQDQEFVLSALRGIDTVVMTNYYARSQGANSELGRRLVRSGKRVILVTNTPYPMATFEGADAAVCTFATNPASLRAAADILYGKARPEGNWPLTRYAVPAG